MSTTSNTLRTGLPPLPARLASAPIDARGYPVPWFVEWIDGKPDHRVMSAAKLPIALRDGLCWICGQRLGVFKTFTIGPMSSITRSISEPPSHIECARFAVQACPFLTRPHAQRREAGLPDVREQAGIPILRNPGAVCIWTTRKFTAYQTQIGNAGTLIELGDPEHTEWYAEGRAATRAEVDASIASGLPLLVEQAKRHGTDGLAYLARCVAQATRLLDGALPDPTQGKATPPMN